MRWQAQKTKGWDTVFEIERVAMAASRVVDEKTLSRATALPHRKTRSHCERTAADCIACDTPATERTTWSEQRRLNESFNDIAGCLPSEHWRLRLNVLLMARR